MIHFLNDVYRTILVINKKVIEGRVPFDDFFSCHRSVFHVMKLIKYCKRGL